MSLSCARLQGLWEKCTPFAKRKTFLESPLPLVMAHCSLGLTMISVTCFSMCECFGEVMALCQGCYDFVSEGLLKTWELTRSK